jgi:hypothetical protein
MRVRLHTLGRHSLRLQDLAHTITRRKRTTSRIGSFKRRQFMPPSTVVIQGL